MKCDYVTKNVLYSFVSLPFSDFVTKDVTKYVTM